MRRGLYIVLGVLVVAGCATFLPTAMTSNKVARHIDDFDGTVWYDAKLTKLAMTGNSYVSAGYYPMSDRYILFVYYHGQDWIFMDRADVSVDGQIFSLSVDDPHRDVHDGGVVAEMAELPIERAELERMANAVSLRFRLAGSDGTTLLEANEAGLEALGDLLSIGTQ